MTTRIQLSNRANATSDQRGRGLIASGIVAMALAVMMILPGCLPAFETSDRAADENQEYSGWQDRGRNPGSGQVHTGYDPTTGEEAWVYDLDYSDVILTPNGDYLMVMVPASAPSSDIVEPGLYLAMQPTAGGAPIVLPWLRNLRRINFSPDGLTAYLLTESGRTIELLDLQGFQPLGTIELGTDYGVIDVSPDGLTVVASNLPTTDTAEVYAGFGACTTWGTTGSRCKMAIIDPLSLTSRQRVLSEPMRDLDFSPIDDEIIVTGQIRGSVGEPITRLTFIDPVTMAATGIIEIPNCADELKLQPGGTLALLSPTTCRNGENVTREQVITHEDLGLCPEPAPNKDPISVIDLQSRTFIKNLPGFGPVVISDDGKRAVGFTRRAEMASDWNYVQVEQAGLIVVDLPSLEWSVIEHGQFEPTYLLAPDGRHLYTYVTAKLCNTCTTPLFDTSSCEDLPTNLTRFDLLTGERAPVQGGTNARLDAFVITPDKTALYFFDASTAAPGVREVRRLTFPSTTTSLTTGLPKDMSLMTVDPDGEFIAFGDRWKPRFSLHDLNGQHIQTLNPRI